MPLKPCPGPVHRPCLRSSTFIYFKGDQSIEYKVLDWRVPENNGTSKNIEKFQNYPSKKFA